MRRLYIKNKNRFLPFWCKYLLRSDVSQSNPQTTEEGIFQYLLSPMRSESHFLFMELHELREQTWKFFKWKFEWFRYIFFEATAVSVGKNSDPFFFQDKMWKLLYENQCAYSLRKLLILIFYLYILWAIGILYCVRLTNYNSYCSVTLKF